MEERKRQRVIDAMDGMKTGMIQQPPQNAGRVKDEATAVDSHGEAKHRRRRRGFAGCPIGQLDVHFRRRRRRRFCLPFCWPLLCGSSFFFATLATVRCVSATGSYSPARCERRRRARRRSHCISRRRGGGSAGVADRPRFRRGSAARRRRRRRRRIPFPSLEEGEASNPFLLLLLFLAFVCVLFTRKRR